MTAAARPLPSGRDDRRSVSSGGPHGPLRSRIGLSQRLVECDPGQRTQRSCVDDVVGAPAGANGVGMMPELQVRHAHERLVQQLLRLRGRADGFLVPSSAKPLMNRPCRGASRMMSVSARATGRSPATWRKSKAALARARRFTSLPSSDREKTAHHLESGRRHCQLLATVP